MAKPNNRIDSYDILALADVLGEKGRSKNLGSFNGCTFGVARFAKHPLWERHPASDELLQVLAGQLDLTVLADDGPIELTLRPGSFVLVPRGLWHSPRPRGSVSLLFLSNDEGSEISNKKDPRS